jgi:hypothetical protein
VPVLISLVHAALYLKAKWYQGQDRVEVRGVS